MRLERGPLNHHTSHPDQLKKKTLVIEIDYAIASEVSLNITRKVRMGKEDDISSIDHTVPVEITKAAINDHQNHDAAIV